jgi:hypothetical protein
MTYFFWTTIRGSRRGQSRKRGDFDKNTKNGLKSSILSFINVLSIGVLIVVP